MIEAVLPVEPVHHAFFNGLDNDNRRVEVGLPVHVPHNPVGKCAKEVTLSKLDDFLRCDALWSSLLIQWFHRP